MCIEAKQNSPCKQCRRCNDPPGEALGYQDQQDGAVPCGAENHAGGNRHETSSGGQPERQVPAAGHDLTGQR